MSADNGVYILETPTDDGSFEYRVRHMTNIEDVSWDNMRNDYTSDEDVVIKNARLRWNNCYVYSTKSDALMHAAEELENLSVCEYGISFVKVNRKF